eukprot:CAMPEP_0194447336 /NCGR_PEP_ID=MMETSP0176-20130528/128956_1 /TAXON_ID=216777 /ORGANISM="Proboscia alata, Strain PI-D3" /LENGTH=133 /DNA_ID=CAMNT_0039274181 /DNA_START=758 /DNA_END=1155 /DNA_ORIENTATION=+
MTVTSARTAQRVCFQSIGWRKGSITRSFSDHVGVTSSVLSALVCVSGVMGDVGDSSDEWVASGFVVCSSRGRPLCSGSRGAVSPNFIRFSEFGTCDDVDVDALLSPLFADITPAMARPNIYCGFLCSVVRDCS